MNVKTGEHKPLLNSRTISVNGMSCYFAMREEYGLSIHWTTHLSKVDGSSQQGIIEYSYMAFKQDAIDSLSKTGMIPYTSMKQFFHESNNKKRMVEENEELRQKVQSLGTENKFLNEENKSNEKRISQLEEQNAALLKIVEKIQGSISKL